MTLQLPAGPAGVALGIVLLIFSAGSIAYVRLVRERRADRRAAHDEHREEVAEPIDLTERIQAVLAEQLEAMRQDVAAARGDAEYWRAQVAPLRQSNARAHARLDRYLMVGEAFNRHVATLETLMVEARLDVPARPPLIAGADPWAMPATGSGPA